MNIANLMGLVASGMWILLIAVIAVAVTRATRNKPVKGFVTSIIVVAVLALIVTTVSAGLVFIQPEERGVVVSAFAPKGYREIPLQPGLSWIIPFAEDVRIYPISKQTYTMSIATQEGQVSGDDSIFARTSDGQEISVDASVIFQINPERVIDVHIAWQNRYEVDLVRAQSRGIIRDAVSQYRVDQVVSTERASMTQQIRNTLTSKLNDNGLILVDFVLRNITFSPEYAAAVEQKQIAEQQALQAEFVVQSKKQEAEQARQVAQGRADAVVIDAKGDAEARLIEAQAEAQALQYIADVLRNNPALLQYQYISELAPGVQTIFVPSENQFILPLPDTTPNSVP
jgi:regulator of protease activity HflC (stomatin/prohibitin superfamily)